MDAPASGLPAFLSWNGMAIVTTLLTITGGLVFRRPTGPDGFQGVREPSRAELVDTGLPEGSHAWTMATLPADVRGRTLFFMDSTGDKYLLPRDIRFAINQKSKTIIPRR